MNPLILTLAWLSIVAVLAASVSMPAPRRDQRWWDDLGERRNR